MIDNLKNVEVEKSVIGCAVGDCTLFKRAKAAGLTADAFTLAEARAVWGTMSDLDGMREEFDLVKLSARAPAFALFIADCMASAPTAAFFDDWAGDLVNLKAARDAVAGLEDARRAIMAEPLKVDVIQRRLDAVGPSYRQCSVGCGLPTLKEVATALVSQMEGRTARNIPLLPYWRQSVFHQGELFILGGISGQGKTALAVSFVNTMLDNSLSVLYCCSESSSVDILARIVSSRCGVPHWKVQNRQATAVELETFNKAFSEVTKCENRLFLYGQGDGRMTPDGVGGCLKRCTAKCGRVDVLVVDYLQDFELERVRSSMTQVNITEEIIKKLHDLAIGEGAACLALSQYSREGEKEAMGGKEPQKWWLKDASKLEHAAHTIAALRPLGKEYFLKCLKHRNCDDFNVKLTSNGAGFVLASPSLNVDATDIPNVDI